VKVSRPDKVLFPDDGITKSELAVYYESVAQPMLRHIKDRPISMQRFPDGIGKHGFFHKDVPDHFPDWVRRVEVPKKNGSPVELGVRDVGNRRFEQGFRG